MGTPLNAKDGGGSLAAHLAMGCPGSSRSRVKYMLENGTDIETRHEGETLLHLAVALDDGVSIVELLLAKGAKVNALNLYGQTPLNSIVDFRGLFYDWGDSDVI